MSHSIVFVVIVILYVLEEGLKVAEQTNKRKIQLMILEIESTYIMNHKNNNNKNKPE
jgi:hypothetical protein